MKIKDERNELENMLKNSSGQIGNSAPVADASALQMDPTFDIDYENRRKNCQRRARRMIKQATGLMISDDAVKNNPYLRSKMQVDIISLSGMLYQLELNEVMQQSLMEEVRMGSAHPRMFEVFGNLSKTIGDLNKQLLQTVEAIKMTYKDIKGDLLEKQEEMKALESGQTSGVFRNKEGLVSIGTKNLIKEARKLKHQNKEDDSKDDIQDIEEIKES
jgi:hypothetical protein